MEPAEIIDDIFSLAPSLTLREDEAASVVLAVESASWDEYALRCEVAGVRPLFTREEFEASETGGFAENA
jgi:hypothetical protein